MIVQNGLSRPLPLGIGRPARRAIPPETNLELSAQAPVGSVLVRILPRDIFANFWTSQRIISGDDFFAASLSSQTRSADNRSGKSGVSLSNLRAAPMSPESTATRNAYSFDSLSTMMLFQFLEDYLAWHVKGISRNQSSYKFFKNAINDSAIGST